MLLLSVAAPSLGFWVLMRFGLRFGITWLSSFGVGGTWFALFLCLCYAISRCGCFSSVRFDYVFVGLLLDSLQI